MTTSKRIDWPAVLDIARDIMATYDTPVTLRQLHYRLVARHLIPNTVPAYHRLSELTAAARRAHTFPAFSDPTSTIHKAYGYKSPRDALASLIEYYSRDHSEGQPEQVWLAVEKNGLVEQMSSWFGDRGLPVVALGGYASQTYVDEIKRDVRLDGRPAVLLYAGDFDPSGEDIFRDVRKRCDVWDEVVHVALTRDQVTEYNLPPGMGKAADSRSAAFVEKHGELIQVEVDALAPPDLKGLFEAALEPYWDLSAFDAVMAQEAADIETLRAVS